VNPWSYKDSNGAIHAVRWTDGQVIGDEQAVALIQVAIDTQRAVDPVGTRASLENEEVAWLTIDSTLRYWFDDVKGPAFDTVAVPLRERDVR
jgi:hypothetical protein